MIRRGITILALFVSLALANDALFNVDRKEGITLKNALSHALLNNEKILSTSFTVLHSKHKVKEAFARFLPSLDITADVGYEARSIKADNTHTKAPQNKIFDYTKNDMFLTFTENIYSGGAMTSNLKEQEKRLEASIYNYRKIVEDIALELIEAYFGVIYNELAYKANQKNVEAFEKITQIMTAKEDAGAATQGDLNFVLANAKNANIQLLQAQTKVIDAKEKYRYLMGYDDIQKLPMQLNTVTEVKDLEYYLKTFEHNNSTLKRQKAYLEASKFSLESQKATFNPTLNLVANLESRDEMNMRDGSIGSMGYQSRGNILLNYKQNLYKGGGDEAKAAQLLARINEQKHALVYEKQKTAYQIKILVAGIQALNGSLELVKEEVENARKVVDSYWASFKEGSQDLQALQMALRTKTNAELNYIASKKRLLVDYFKLLKHSGILLEYLQLYYGKDSKDFTHQFSTSSWR